MEVPVKRDDTDVRQQEEEPVYNPLYVPGKGDRPFVSKEVPGQLRWGSCERVRTDGKASRGVPEPTKAAAPTTGGSNSNAVKFLVVGDVRGKFHALFDQVHMPSSLVPLAASRHRAQVRKTNAKAGPFAAVFCVGEFFDPEDADNDELMCALPPCPCRLGRLHIDWNCYGHHACLAVVVCLCDTGALRRGDM